MPDDLHARLVAALQARLEVARRDLHGAAWATEIRRVEALLRVVERHVPPVMIGNAPAVCDFCIDAGITDWPCPDIRDLAAGEGIEDA